AHEDWLSHTEGTVPGLRGCVDEAIQSVAFQSARPGERDARKEGSLGDTDLRVGCDDDFFRLADVRPPLEQFCRQVSGNGLEHRLLRKRLTAGNRLAPSRSGLVRP